MISQLEKLKKEKAKLLLANLSKALKRLKEAASQPPTVFNQDSTIKRFEFTFEMSWKLMKSILDIEGEKTPTPRTTIRKAADIQLIDSVEKWFEYLEARNLTVHTYKEEIAKEVYKKAKEFILVVEDLIKKAKNYLKQEKN